MYITGIRYRRHGVNAATAWRLTQGVGKMRPVVTVTGDDESLEMLAHAINFALAGKRHRDLAEVWLDAADDAGDVWTIERGAKGSVFRRNSRLLTIEEAQRSLLASLLDLDASLNQTDALVAPVELRQIITQGIDVAATVWDMNTRHGRTDVLSLAAAKDLARKIASASGHENWSDPRKLARIAGPASRILGAFEELKNQADQLSTEVVDDPGIDPSLENIQSEVDILNQIDQHIRRINEGGESYGRLTGMLETFDRRIAEIETKWSKETLGAVQRLGDPSKIIEQAVRLRAWGRLVESLRKARSIVEEQVLPVASDGLRVWDNFLSQAGTNGQDIESCLASMLLGIKQMAQEVDRYVGQVAVADSSRSIKASSWFDRLKTGSTRVLDDNKFKDSAPALNHQRDWISRLAREVEAVKVATEYALQSSQGLQDRLNQGKDRLQSDTGAIGAILQKAGSEWERLRSEWLNSTALLSLDESIGMEQLVSVIRDANEHMIILDTRHDLAVRVEERRHVQSSLEVLVRKWWEIIGSQKSTDLSNVSFLIVEAKGALRYREGRKQRIQKGLEETSKAMATKTAADWVSSRKEELTKDWIKLFTMAELSAPALGEDLSKQVSDVALRCATLLDIARLEEQERFAAASLWPSRLDSAVVVYRWAVRHVPIPQRTNFIKSLNSFTGESGVPVLLLISDQELAQALAKSGTGSSNMTELSDPAAVDGPRREGGVVKAEMKAKRNVSQTAKSEIKVDDSSASASRSLLTPRAEAALRILNPKSPKP